MYCVIPRNTSGPSGTSLTFLIDSQVAGTFERQSEGIEGYEYDVLVFSRQGLPNGQHYFVLRVGETGGPDTLVLLDRIIYRYAAMRSTISPNELHY